MLLLRNLIATWMLLYVVTAVLRKATAAKHNIVQRPATHIQLAKVGFPSKLTCVFAFPESRYTVSWTKKGVLLVKHDPEKSLTISKDGRTYTISKPEKTASLRIQDVSIDGAGEYSCRTVLPKAGKPEARYWKLEVQDGPTMKSISSVQENQTLSAECCVTFTDSRIQVKYLWSVDTALATTYRTNVTENPICSNVSFTATRKHHNKLLVCTIENELNSTTQERINVTYPASAEWRPPYNSMTSVIAGRYTNITITCISDGNPPPLNLLQKYDTSMSRWVNTSIIPNLIKEEGAQRTWTMLYNVTNSISERLRCFAFNGFKNQVEENGFLVETQVPATVEMFLKQTYANGGYQVVIECVTYGHPIPDVFLQRKGGDKWETVMDVLPSIDNVTPKQRQVTWKFYFRIEKSIQVEAYRCRANNTFRYFDDSDVVMINIKLTFDVFLVENLQAIICVFVASVIIVALLVAFKYYQKKVSSNFLPAVTRYSRLVRNSIHFPSNFHRAGNNQAPTLPDTRSIPGFGSNITRDQSVDPYEELPCNDVDGKETHALDFYLPGEVASYAAVQKNSCTTLSAGHNKSKQEEEDDDYIGISLELQSTQI